MQSQYEEASAEFRVDSYSCDGRRGVLFNLVMPESLLKRPLTSLLMSQELIMALFIGQRTMRWDLELEK